MPRKIEERISLTTTAPWTDAGMDLDLAREVPLFCRPTGDGKFRRTAAAVGIFNETVGNVVATVGSRYAIVQHEEVLLSTLNALEELGVQPTRIKAVQSDTRCAIYVELNERRDVGRYGPGGSVATTDDDSVGDIINFGFRIINTLDGTTPVVAGLYAQRLACKNGMLGSLENVMTVSRKHTKSQTADLDERLKKFVDKAVRQIEEWVGTIKESIDAIVTQEEMERMVDATFSKRIANKVKDNLLAYSIELGQNRWAVYNAATHVLTHELNEPSQATLERHHATANKLFTMEIPALVVAE